MEVTDKKLAADLEAKMKKEYIIAKRWVKRQNGVIGKIVSFKDNLLKKKADIVIDETKGEYGRAGNRIYIRDKLFKKFKNATKAKKFMKGIK